MEINSNCGPEPFVSIMVYGKTAELYGNYQEATST